MNSLALLVVVAVACFQLTSSMSVADQKISIVTCKNSYCEATLLAAIKNGCQGQVCLNYVKTHRPECMVCADEIKNTNLFETINGDKKVFPCFNEDPTQLAQCKFMCNINYFDTGSCKTVPVKNDHGANGNIDYCGCLYL